MKCEKCHNKYPSKFIKPMYASDEPTRMVCPPCALKTMSEVHGVKFTRFHGTYAQALYEEFMKKYGGKHANRS